MATSDPRIDQYIEQSLPFAQPILRHLREAQIVFGDAASAREWLRAPNPALGHQTPVEALRTVSGTRDVEMVLIRIEHGVDE